MFEFFTKILTPLFITLGLVNPTPEPIAVEPVPIVEEAQEAIGAFVPEKLMNYINNGSTVGSVNMPVVQLPSQSNQHRILHIHKNESGVLAQINNVIASNKVNISGQYLKTNEELGYVIIDIEGEYPSSFISELKSLDYTLKSRILY